MTYQKITRPSRLSLDEAKEQLGLCDEPKPGLYDDPDGPYRVYIAYRGEIDEHLTLIVDPDGMVIKIYHR